MSRAGAVVCSMCSVPPGRRMSDAFITAFEGDTSQVLRITDPPWLDLDRNRHNSCQLTQQEDWMTSHLSYLIAQHRQAQLVSRAERAWLASEARLARSAL